MDFLESKGIYLQIVDQLCDRILCGEWTVNERIPAIREMAALLGVNPNTVTRSYKELMDLNIIFNRRGIGYFVSQDALQRIHNNKRNEFVKNELPHFFTTMNQLGLGWSDIEKIYRDFQETGEV